MQDLWAKRQRGRVPWRPTTTPQQQNLASPKHPSKASMTSNITQATYSIRSEMPQTDVCTDGTWLDRSGSRAAVTTEAKRSSPPIASLASQSHCTPHTASSYTPCPVALSFRHERPEHNASECSSWDGDNPAHSNLLQGVHIQLMPAFY